MDMNRTKTNDGLANCKPSVITVTGDTSGVRGPLYGWPKHWC